MRCNSEAIVFEDHFGLIVLGRPPILACDAGERRELGAVLGNYPRIAGVGLQSLPIDARNTFLRRDPSKLFMQIDPMRLAEDSRSVKIIEQYAERLTKKNVREGAVHALVNNYPAHNFVIDPEEAAKQIFIKTEPPIPELALLGEHIKIVSGGSLYEDDPFLLFLTDDIDTEEETGATDSQPTEAPQSNENDTDGAIIPEGETAADSGG